MSVAVEMTSSVIVNSTPSIFTMPLFQFFNHSLGDQGLPSMEHIYKSHKFPFFQNVPDLFLPVPFLGFPLGHFPNHFVLDDYKKSSVETPQKLS